MKLSRRSVLQAGGGAIALSTVAGCLSEPDNGGSGGDSGGYAAFFALWDWTEQVVGDELTVDDPVDTGQIGHGWNPPGDLQQRVADSAFFVYLDTREFQWARDIAADLDSETTLIDGMEGLDDQLLPVDRHVWLDPVLVQEIVATIADGIVEIDPDNEELYQDNADAYIDRVADVDQQYEELAENATRDVGVFAGHDSFQYIEDRYGIELHTPVGTSPDEDVLPEDISELIDVVNEHDIDTVLYDPFETQDIDDVPEMVDVILDETDATDSAPLTPAEGTTERWNNQGYGWIEQMIDINLTSLEAALGVE